MIMYCSATMTAIAQAPAYEYMPYQNNRGAKVQVADLTVQLKKEYKNERSVYKEPAKLFVLSATFSCAQLCWILIVCLLLYAAMLLFTLCAFLNSLNPKELTLRTAKFQQEYLILYKAILLIAG